MSGSKRLWSRDPTLHTNFSAFVCLHSVPRALFLFLPLSPQARPSFIVYVKSVHLLPSAWVQHSCCCICSTNKSKFILCDMKGGNELGLNYLSSAVRLQGKCDFHQMQEKNLQQLDLSLKDPFLLYKIYTQKKNKTSDPKEKSKKLLVPRSLSLQAPVCLFSHTERLIGLRVVGYASNWLWPATLRPCL